MKSSWETKVAELDGGSLGGNQLSSICFGPHGRVANCCGKKSMQEATAKSAHRILADVVCQLELGSLRLNTMFTFKLLTSIFSAAEVAAASDHEETT